MPKGAWTHPGSRVARSAGAFGSPDAHTVAGRGRGAPAGGDRRRVPCRARGRRRRGRRRRRGGARLHRRGRGVGGHRARRRARSPTSTWSRTTSGSARWRSSNALYDPPTVYAVMESAWAHAGGWDAAEHRRRLGGLWAGFAAVAATNPVAWRTDAPDAADHRRPVAGQPHGRLALHEALLLEPAGEPGRRAGRHHGGHRPRPRHPSGPLGLPPRRRGVQPRRTGRAAHDLARSPVAARRRPRALEIAGAAVDDLGPIDLYSCFPVAVQIGGARARAPARSAAHRHRRHDASRAVR